MGKTQLNETTCEEKNIDTHGKEQNNKTTCEEKKTLIHMGKSKLTRQLERILKICLVKNVDTNETFSEGTKYRTALDKFLVKDLNPKGTTK